jgi:hypothetical protein
MRRRIKLNVFIQLKSRRNGLKLGGRRVPQYNVKFFIKAFVDTKSAINRIRSQNINTKRK